MKLFFLVIIMLTGCSGSSNIFKNEIHSANIFDDRTSVYRNKKFYVNEDNSKIKEFQNKNKSIEEREKYLQQEINKIKNIENSNVSIMGNIGVVSIQVLGRLDDQKLIDLKNEVTAKVKSLDYEIDHISVNAGAEFFRNSKDKINIDDNKNNTIDKNSSLGDVIEENLPAS